MGTSCFNGRIEHAALTAAARDDAGIEALRAGIVAGDDIVGAWDFSLEMPTDRVIDRSVNACHGRTVNLPIRAVRGSAWTGDERCWRRAVALRGDALSRRRHP